MSKPITELKSTMFVTPVISTIMRWLSICILKLTGWKVSGEKPGDPKYIMVAAPHTSNWDFVLLLLTAFTLRLDAHWMGKASLFPYPFRRLMVWLGGIPIDRSQANNVVSQMADYFESVEQLIVIIPPEGTRSKVNEWKTGFYHIAQQANVPIVLGFIDAGTRTVGFGPRLLAGGDVEVEIGQIKKYYSGKKGLVPDNF